MAVDAELRPGPQDQRARVREGSSSRLVVEHAPDDLQHAVLGDDRPVDTSGAQGPNCDMAHVDDPAGAGHRRGRADVQQRARGDRQCRMEGPCAHRPAQFTPDRDRLGERERPPRDLARAGPQGQEAGPRHGAPRSPQHRRDRSQTGHNPIGLNMDQVRARRAVERDRPSRGGERAEGGRAVEDKPLARGGREGAQQAHGAVEGDDARARRDLHVGHARHHAVERHVRARTGERRAVGESGRAVVRLLARGPHDPAAQRQARAGVDRQEPQQPSVGRADFTRESRRGGPGGHGERTPYPRLGVDRAGDEHRRARRGSAAVGGVEDGPGEEAHTVADLDCSAVGDDAPAGLEGAARAGDEDARTRCAAEDARRTDLAPRHGHAQFRIVQQEKVIGDQQFCRAVLAAVGDKGEAVLDAFQFLACQVQLITRRRARQFDVPQRIICFEGQGRGARDGAEEVDLRGTDERIPRPCLERSGEGDDAAADEPRLVVEPHALAEGLIPDGPHGCRDRGEAAPGGHGEKAGPFRK